MHESPVPKLKTKVAFAATSLVTRLARRPARRESTDAVERILVLELWNIGDVILAMPFLAQLRGRFPRARITLLGRPMARDLLAGTGLVDDVIPAELAWGHEDGIALTKKIVGIWRAVRSVRAKKFDLAFSARLHLREHVLLGLSGSGRTIGYSYSAHDPTLTDPAPPSDLASHRVQAWMRLLEPFGGAASIQTPRLHVSDGERLWANGFVVSRGVAEEDLLIGVHPGASLAEKRWPLDGFREVIAGTLAQPGVRVLAFSDPSGYGSNLSTIPGVIGARVSLRELIALIGRCDLLVCNDSGPMHIAGALGIPTVAMFGWGIDQLFAPLGENHELLCSSPETESDASTAGRGIRSPKGIGSTEVLAAVGRAVQRLRGRRTLSRA